MQHAVVASGMEVERVRALVARQGSATGPQRDPSELCRTWRTKGSILSYVCNIRVFLWSPVSSLALHHVIFSCAVIHVHFHCLSCFMILTMSFDSI